jgi:hypothetical protein
MSEPNTSAGRRIDRSSARVGWGRNGLRIAVMSGRRQLRRLLAAPRTTGVKLLLWVGVWVVALRPWEGRAPGEMPVSNVPAGVELMPLYRSGFTALWVVMFVFGVIGATKALDDLEIETAVLRVAGVRATVLGRLVFEHSRRLVLVGLVGGIELVSLLVGGGASLTFALGLLGLIGLEVTAGLAGEALALAYASVSKRTLVGEYALFVVVGLWIAAATAATRWTELVVGLLARSPTGWFADLLFLGTAGVEANPRFAAGAVVFSTVGTGVLFVLYDRLARRVWFDPSGRTENGEPGEAGTDDSDGTRLPTTSRVSRRLTDRVPVSPAARAIAWRVTTRAVRQPSVLYLVSLPAIFAVAFSLSEHWHAWHPFALALSGAWAAGAGVTLNPLASEGVGLPALLTAPVTARDLLAGYVVAGVALAAPFVVVPTLTFSLYRGVSMVTAAQAVSLGLLCSVFGATFAFGIGVGLPKLRTLSVSEADAPMPPSQFTVLLYTVTFGLVVGPAVAGLFAERLPVSADPALAAVAGLSVTAVLAVAASVAASRYATRRLDGFELSA